jgi:excisionase family DNA binding protein
MHLHHTPRIALIYADGANGAIDVQDKRFMTARQVAAAFEVSPSTVHRWAKEGKLPSFATPGGRLRFPRESIEEMAMVSDPKKRDEEGETK